MELKEALEILTDRYQAVIRKRVDGQTLRSIGNDLGVTGERIRQIEARAMRLLRQNYKDDLTFKELKKKIRQEFQVNAQKKKR